MISKHFATIGKYDKNINIQVKVKTRRTRRYAFMHSSRYEINFSNAFGTNFFVVTRDGSREGFNNV